MGGLLVLLFSLSSLYRTAVVQVLTGADAFSSLPSPHYKFLKSIRQQLTRKDVFPEAREGFRRGPENPQDPHHPDFSQSPIPSASRVPSVCLPRLSRSPPERHPVVRVARRGTCEMRIHKRLIDLNTPTEV